VATIAPDIEKLRELDDDVRRAWHDYYDHIQDLTGAEYEQGELCRIERRRRLLTVTNG
jgi:hypothetical protein